MNLKYYSRVLLTFSFSSLLLFNSSCSSEDTDSETEIIDENSTDNTTEEIDKEETDTDNETEGEGTDTGSEETDTDTDTEEETDPDPEGTDPDNTLSCLVTLGGNYIVFDAEATESPLDQWKLITKGDAGYLDKESLGPINETHLEFTGNNEASGPATSPLDYVFTAPTTGAYKLLMRLYQRLEGAESDKSNDVYIRMAGNFTSATDQYTTADLQTDMKFFGRGIDQWGGIYSGEGGEANNKSAVLYNFKEGEEYTFTMSGRSQRANIDYILLYDTKDISITTGANKDIAELNDAQYRPDWGCNQ